MTEAEKVLWSRIKKEKSEWDVFQETASLRNLYFGFFLL